MTRHPLLTLFAVVIIVGTLVYGVIRSRLGTPAAPETPAQAMALQSTQEPSATATPSPLPTVDYQQVYPAQTQAAAAYDLAQSQERIARAAATMARATEQGYQAALLIGTPTAIERQTQQAEQTAQAQADREAAYIEQERARILAEIDKAKNAEITRQNLNFAVWLIGGIVAGAIVIAVVFVMAYRAQVATWQRAAGGAMDAPLDNIAPVTDAPGFISVGVTTSHPSRVPVPPEVFAVWAARMLEGGTAGINKWETGDSPFSRNAENGKPAYVPFLDWATERGYISESGGAKVLSERGQLFCRGWLQRRGTPPPAEAAHETAEKPMIHTIPCPPDDGGVGEEG